MEKIRIKYFTDKIEKLTYIDGKSDWIDLRASEEVEMKAGEFKLIPLGVAMELPKGYEAHIMPRSSSYKNFGIIQANSCGIVDGKGHAQKLHRVFRDAHVHELAGPCPFGNLRGFGGQAEDAGRHLLVGDDTSRLLVLLSHATRPSVGGPAGQRAPGARLSWRKSPAPSRWQRPRW